MICFLKFIPVILHGDLTTSCSPVGGEFDFSKSQISTISPTTPGRGEVGDNIDRCITDLQKGSGNIYLKFSQRVTTNIYWYTSLNGWFKFIILCISEVTGIGCV